MIISEVMKRTGLTRKAIYLYEERGLLVPAKDGSFREYSAEDVSRLVTIARMRELGISLQDIARIFSQNSGVDLLLQMHLALEQERLSELIQTIAKLNTIIYNLPPHSTLTDFEQAADTVLPRTVSPELSSRLEKEYPQGYVRRLAMQLYEAFLDVPLDTPERWDAWYTLLDEIEQSKNEQVLDAHAEYYGSMTADQLYEDYTLRRRLVTEYPQYGEAEMRAKTEEIIQELFRLTEEEAIRREWKRFYTKIVRPVHQQQYHVDAHMKLLSNVYHPYNHKFHEIEKTMLHPYLQTEEGARLTKHLKEILGEFYEENSIWMIYFDFYNNTIRRVLYPTLTKAAGRL